MLPVRGQSNKTYSLIISLIKSVKGSDYWLTLKRQQPICATFRSKKGQDTWQLGRRLKKGPYDKIWKVESDAYFEDSIQVEPFLKISMIYHKK